MTMMRDLTEQEQIILVGLTAARDIDVSMGGDGWMSAYHLTNDSGALMSLHRLGLVDLELRRVEMPGGAMAAAWVRAT